MHFLLIFLFFADDRFIIKEMSRLEMQIFLDFAPNYFAYMEKCQQTKQPTLLGKIVGVYRVSFKNNTTNAALRTSVLVMENLFYNRVITDKFDLKGSVRNRLVNPDDTCHEGELVLLDENLLNSMYRSLFSDYLRIDELLRKILNERVSRYSELRFSSVYQIAFQGGIKPSHRTGHQVFSGQLCNGLFVISRLRAKLRRARARYNR